MNPPGVFKKAKGKREFGEKYDSKFYPDNYKKDVIYMNYNDLLDDIYMENKGIDFGLRCYKNYNKAQEKRKNRTKNPKRHFLENDNSEKHTKDDVNELMKKYVNNQFTFKQNYDNKFDPNEEIIIINKDTNLEQNNDMNNPENKMENINIEKNLVNQNDNYKDQNRVIIGEKDDDLNRNIQYEDIRLKYVMEKLGLDSLIPIFEQYHMSFNDILFLTKDDLNELGLKIFQKNRLISFIEEYSSQSKNYTLEEIQTFFDKNKIYNISNIQENC